MFDHFKGYGSKINYVTGPQIKDGFETLSTSFTYTVPYTEADKTSLWTLLHGDYPLNDRVLNFKQFMGFLLVDQVFDKYALLHDDKKNTVLPAHLIEQVLRTWQLPVVDIFFKDHKAGANNLKQITYDWRPIVVKTLLCECDACNDLRWVNKPTQMSNYIDKRKLYDADWNDGHMSQDRVTTGYTATQRGGLLLPPPPPPA